MSYIANFDFPPGPGASLDNVKLEFVSANPLDQDRGSLSGHIDYVGVDAGGERVMGVGQWLADHLRPRLDPVLRWPVPRGWTAKDAATVPYVYALVYLHLKVKAHAKKKESILVLDAASAIGQASIRIANMLGCSPIYATTRDDEQREFLLQVFPQLEPSHVLTSANCDSFEYQFRKLTNSRGARLVVNTAPNYELALRCVVPWGRLLHFTREDMQRARTVGMRPFMYSRAMFGCQGSELFNCIAEHRAEVAAAVSHGIRTGAILPIVGAKVFNSAEGVGDLVGCTKAVIEVGSASRPADQQCDPNKCYLVVGKQASEALLVAGRLSMLGARHVLAAVGSAPSAAVVRQRQRVLRRQHSTTLHVQQVRVCDEASAAGVVRMAGSVAPLHAVVVIGKAADASVSGALFGALSALPEVGVVLLADHGRAAGQLQAPASQRAAQGRRTAFMAAPLAEAIDHLAELLCGVAPANTVPSTAAASEGTIRDTRRLLPLAALASLGRSALRCAGAPTFRELPSLTSPSRYPHELQPLVVLPPLGLLDPAAKEQLAHLAARLYCPVLVVESAAGAGVSRQAKSVAEVRTAAKPLATLSHMTTKQLMSSVTRPPGDSAPAAVRPVQPPGLPTQHCSGPGSAAPVGGVRQAGQAVPGARGRQRSPSVGRRRPGAVRARGQSRGHSRGCPRGPNREGPPRRHRPAPVGRSATLRVGRAHRPHLRGRSAGLRRGRE
ncbi:hypothetical protein ONE63_005987 [Megalurothrips usitatus]|uniref:Enoyl reductase (ER) domain-containing protein n=1 Tax=Megalurothrips usitatus TaxID=439358 RepID=A0AAV7XV89_9NEOP|nr:hypothetical protein ONE63_005987 [Megalurothrips usitatus]